MTSSEASANRNMVAGVLLGMTLVGGLFGFQRYSDMYMGSLRGVSSPATRVMSLHLTPLPNTGTVQSDVAILAPTTNNSACPTTMDANHTRMNPLSSEIRNNHPLVVYPNRTDVVYYVEARGRRDRSGAAIADMLKAQAYSFSRGIPFGGACGATPHQATNEQMIQVLGLDPILQYQCPPTTVDENSNVRHEMIGRDKYFADNFFTDAWLKYIHETVQPQSKRWMEEDRGNNSNTMTDTSNYTVVAHIRRGDVDPCGHWSFRYLPNSHYAGLIDTYARYAPRGKQVECIVFSESHSLVENFDDFYGRRCQVILDGDPTEAWKAMLDADALIMSLSSFSALPALLNQHGTIAFTPSLIEPLRNDWKWHVHKQTNQGWRHLINLCDQLNANQQ